MTARVCLSFDFDAVANAQTTDADADPAAYSRALFGPEVGVPRLLEFLDRYGVTATWFVPGQTIESFPDVCEAICEAGHAVGHHGWSHRSPRAYESRAAERADLERGIAAVEALTGEAPAGYRAPQWEFSEHTLDLLLELGFEWDSSLMGREFNPYHVRRAPETPPDGPYVPGEPTDLVELPVSFQRDDWPPFGSGPGGNFADEAAIFDIWREQFDYMLEHVPDGVYTLTMHPQIIGMSHRMAHLEGLVRHMRGRADVAFTTLPAVAAAFDG